MENIIKLILFLTYTIAIFFISNYIIILIFAIINIALMLIYKSSLVSLLRLTPLIIFTALLNLIFGSLESAILVLVRLILVCNFTLTFRNILSVVEISEVVSYISKDLGLIVSIGIAFMPILAKELSEIRYALQAKGMKVNLKNTKYVIKPFMYGLIKRTDEITYALHAKGYEE